MNSDTITILRSRGRRLAKLVKADGAIIGYDEAKTFTAIEHDVESLDDLHRALVWLSTRPDRCIVRAALINPTITGPIRRLLYADRETGDHPTLYEVPRFWIATDWDALVKPDDVDVTDLDACGRVALARLPTAFHKAACIVSATASHGIKPGIRVRLWHWLNRAITGAEIGRWLGPIGGLDASIFRPVQAIYTSAPQFESGIDPLPARTIMLPGEPRVAVPAAATLAPPPPVRQPAPLPAPGDGNAARYAFGALRNATARIAMAGVGSRHAAIISEARGLSRFTTAGLLDAATVRRALADAAAAAGKPQGEADLAIDWAAAHPSLAPIAVAAHG